MAKRGCAASSQLHSFLTLLECEYTRYVSRRRSLAFCSRLDHSTVFRSSTIYHQVKTQHARENAIHERSDLITQPCHAGIRNCTTNLPGRLEEQVGEDEDGQHQSANNLDGNALRGRNDLFGLLHRRVDARLGLSASSLSQTRDHRPCRFGKLRA